MAFQKASYGIKDLIKTTCWVWGLHMQIAPTYTVLHTITQIILSIQGLVNAFFLGYALDLASEISSSANPQFSDFIPLIILVIVVNLVFQTVTLVNNYCERLLDIHQNLKLRTFLYEHLNKLGIAQLENPEIANRAQRFMEATGTIANHLALFTTLIGRTLTIVSSGIVLLKTIPLLVPFYLITFLIKWNFNQYYVRKLWLLNLHNTEYRRKAFTSAGTISDSIYLKELKITGGFDYIKHKYEAYVGWFIMEIKKIRNKWAVSRYFQYVLDVAGLGAGLGILLNQVIKGTLSVGQLAFHFRTLSIFSESIDAITFQLVNIRESSIKLADALELFEKFPADEDGSITLEPTVASPRIELKGVNFKYPHSKRNVLEGIDLTILPGEKIAIVGENGAGKTTLVKLIGRFYRPVGGEIKINEINLNDIKVDSWHKKLGILFQDFNQYSHLDVRENVGIGDVHKQFNEEEIKLAIKRADATDFVNKYPSGLEQILSEKYKEGIRPSTGQWQKLAIARFFYRNAPVLILDEPTASIDAVAEAEIFNNIYKFIENKTVIIISHRFSTVRNADRIIVLDKGKIIEQGSHEELLKKKGKYANAFKLQAKGYE